MWLGMVKKLTRVKFVSSHVHGISQRKTKGTVLLKNADEMLNFTRGEEQHFGDGILILLHLHSTVQPTSARSSKTIADSGVELIIAAYNCRRTRPTYTSTVQHRVTSKVRSKYDLAASCRVRWRHTPLLALAHQRREKPASVRYIRGAMRNRWRPGKSSV